MDELIQQLSAACFGLTVEDVEAQLAEIPSVPEEKRGTLAAYLVSLADAA